MEWEAGSFFFAYFLLVGTAPDPHAKAAGGGGGVAVLPKPEAVRRELRNKEELTPPRHGKGPTSARLPPGPINSLLLLLLVARMVP